MNIYSKILLSRLKYILLFLIIFFGIIICNLFRLQIIMMPSFFSQGNQNCLRYEKVPSARGNITDSNGNLLATNFPIYSLYWNGSGAKELNENQIDLLQTVKEFIEISPELEIKIITAEKYGQKILLKDEIPLEQLSKIIEKFPDHKNLSLIKQFKRFYPHKAVACHLLGYLGYIDMEPTGKMGIEHLFDDTLKGQAGEIISTVNSIGKKLQEQELKKALTGDSIKTTLNLELQNIAEELFPPSESGTCIIIDPETGDIITLLSRPSFDPNIFVSTLSQEQWEALQEKKCFINRAFNACFPPASLFKIITMAAALDTKLVDRYSASWHCLGHMTYADREIHCNRLEGHGVVNAKGALAHSCNIPFYEIGKKIKIDTLAEYAKKFGLGSKTTNFFPEKEGLIPTSAWKRRIKGTPWYQGETLSTAIGQSYLLVTPAQIACMISGVCQGFIPKLKILESQEVSIEPLDIPNDIRLFLKDSLKQVIQIGTGRLLNRLNEIEIYGKTGTAQTSELSKRTLGKKFVEHGYLAIYFKYKQQKPLVMVILLENVGSSYVATDLGLRILKAYCASVDKKEAPATVLATI